MDNESSLWISPARRDTLNDQLHLITNIYFFPKCSSIEVCRAIWYCFDEPFMTVIGIAASVFAISGFFTNALSLYKMCKRRTQISPTMTMIIVLSGSNCVSVVTTYGPFLVYFNYLGETFESSAEYKVAAVLTVSFITISGFYVSQLAGLRFILVRYPLFSLRHVTPRRIVLVSVIIFIINLLICTTFQISQFHFFPSTDPIREFKTRTIKRQILQSLPVVFVLIFHFLKKQSLQNTHGARDICQRMSVTVSFLVLAHVLAWTMNIVPLIVIFSIKQENVHKYSHTLYSITLLAWMLYYTCIPIILVFRANYRTTRTLTRNSMNRGNCSLKTSSTTV